MNDQTPAPIAKSFLMCRSIQMDPATGRLTLVSPVSTLLVDRVPIKPVISVFVRMTEIRGVQKMSLEIRKLDGARVKLLPLPPAPVQDDMLSTPMFVWADLPFEFPEFGQYEIALLANSVDVLIDYVTIAQRPMSRSGSASVQSPP